jgi:hypothetical protein
MKLVSSGRAKLQGTALPEAPGPNDEMFDMATGEHSTVAADAGVKADLDDDDDVLSHLPPPPD